MSYHKKECPYDYFISEDEKTVYVNITSAVTAMGFPALMREYFRGYIGQIATKEKIETLREMSSKLNK